MPAILLEWSVTFIIFRVYVLHSKMKIKFFIYFFAIDPILLSSKSKEWTIAYSEGGNEDARAGVILTRCDSVQRKRWH
jgi:hypothetical protein